MQEPENHLKEHPDLYQRSIKGSYWVFVIGFATQFFSLVKSIIVFNFLFNENLELIIVANLLMAVLNRFSESGFQAALVQKKEGVADYLDTAWVFGILRGVVLFAAIYFAAPLFASFRVAAEDVPLAIAIIRAMGFCYLLQAFRNIGVVYFQKELQFHKTFWLKMAGTITDIVFSISLVLIFRSAWGYVIARLISECVNLAMSYWLCSYRPGLNFVPQKARELWKFGRWLFGANVLRYLLNEGDDWFVWFYLGGGPLKIYRYAYKFSNLPATHIASTVAQVSFPAYSMIQDDLPRLRDAYLKSLRATAIISIPMAFLIFCLGPDFVRLFLVEESHAMIPIVQLLAFKGLLKTVGALRGSLFKAMGKPDTTWYLRCARLAILIITIYPLTKIWGVAGTAVATILFSLIVNPFGFLLSCRMLECPRWQMFRPSLFPMIAAGLITSITVCLQSYCIKQPTVMWFLGLVILFAAGYILSLLLLDCFFKTGSRDILMGQLQLLWLRFKGSRK